MTKSLILVALLAVMLNKYLIDQTNQNKVEDKPESAEKAEEQKPQDIKNTQWYKPKQGISWQWQLQGNINTNYNVDLYDIDLMETSQAAIDKLHDKNIKVICYFSAGSWENYRDDAKEFPKGIIGKTLEGWQDEKWLDISNYEKFGDIMQNRLDLAVQKKCDGVEPDNIDGFQKNNGFKLSYKDQLKYNKWLAEEAHKRNLSIALKNDLEQVGDLIDYYDFAINEECFYNKECDLLLPFQKLPLFTRTLLTIHKLSTRNNIIY